MHGTWDPAIMASADRVAFDRPLVFHPAALVDLACDEQGRVFGVEGLVVADASLIPTTVRATTNLPTVVVAERIAEWLNR